jgi:HK97 gp10 family phage protein
MNTTIKIEGIAELKRALGKLPKSLQAAGEKSALRGGAFLISKAAKSRAPVASGHLKKAIGISVKTVKGRTTARIGAKSDRKTVIRYGKEAISNPANYSHLVEYGNATTPARPFIRPAVESTKGAVINAMAAGFNRHLGKVINKIRSRK